MPPARERVFGKRERESFRYVIDTLRTEITDLRGQLLREREAWAKEKRELLDRILAVTAPGGLRELTRTALPTTTLPPLGRGPVTTGNQRPERLHYPTGAIKTPYPSVPASPPHVPGLHETLHDAEVVAVVDKAKQE